MFDTPRWSDSVRDWLTALRAPALSPAIAMTVEDIQKAMLFTLRASQQTPTAGGLRLALRIRRCADIQLLWYLRSDLMQELCKVGGEQQAVGKLEEISAMFKGLLPHSLQPHRRPSPPHRRYDSRLKGSPAK